MRKLLIFILAICLLPLCSCRANGEENTLYYISATFDGKNGLDCKMTVDYFNDTQTEITELWFNLHANAYREGARISLTTAESEAKAFPYGKSYGCISVEQCSSQGEPVDFKVCGQDENLLVLRLKKGVFPGERCVVGLEFSLTLAECRLRLGAIDGYVNLGNWYPSLCARDHGGFYECVHSPVGDPFFSDCADVTIELTVPGEYSVAHGGVCERTIVDGAQTTYVISVDNARDVGLCLNKNFDVFVGKTGDIDVRVYSVGRADGGEIVDATVKAIDTFSELFGKYPYPSMTVAITPFAQGGMEYTGFCMVKDTLSSEEAISATVHETAHQWWYSAVGNNQIEHAFLDEGLAEYSTLLFYEFNPEYQATREGLVNDKNNEYRAFYGVLEQLLGSVRTDMDRALNEFSSEYEYVEIAYVRSLLMIDGLRQSVGDGKFFKGLKYFYANNLFEIATPDRLISAFERVGCDCEAYLKSFIEGKAII